MLRKRVIILIILLTFLLSFTYWANLVTERPLPPWRAGAGAIGWIAGRTVGTETGLIAA